MADNVQNQTSPSKNKQKSLQFTHLHLHSEYSLLDGTIKIPKLVERLTELEMKACALTDHGNMYGTYKFYKAMKEAGLKPILGCEIYISPRDHTTKEAGIDNKYNHMLLIAKNLQGYKNLMKIVSIGHLEGFYYKPRVSIDVLRKYSEGIIATTACLGGVVAKELLNGNRAKATENAKTYAEIFKDGFYIEIQRNGLPEQEEVNPVMTEIAKELNLPIVATCDAHYLKKEDSVIQEVLWCIGDGKTLDDPNRRQMGSKELYVKSNEEMLELFADLPEAIESTQRIVESVEDFEIQFGRVEPKFLEIPEGKDSEVLLREIAYEGIIQKYGEMRADVKERVDYELNVIHEKGYDDYFLIVRDFIQFCRKNDIVVGIRGSACGSAVAYTVDITHLDPISWELYFERFLNPERKSAPDIDIDFADTRRNEVIEYTVQKYGQKNVCAIGTFSKLQTRQAIRDVGRCLGIDLGITDQLSKMVEIVFGKAKDIDYMIENNKEFAEIINSSEKTKELAEIVRKVAGLSRGVSTHACGFVITPTDVTDYVPMQRDSKGLDIGMTQFDMSDLEEVGLMKYDFLGLRNLSVIGECLIKIEESKNEKINLFKLDPHDENTFKLLESAQTVGVFQLESQGMQKTVRSIKPDTLEEICYLVAAYRPGPMQFIPEFSAVKFKEKEAEYLIPELEPILGVTNGVITYQEQVMRIAVDIAGYTMGAADVLRKAMGKKKMDVMEAEKPIFIEGAVKNGYPQDAMEQLWERLLQFANYGFNKAHAASYALVSYWTAYLKANYKLEFMAALLEGDLDDFERVIIDLQECERLGIRVLAPDINKSSFKFTIEGDNAIRFGLAAIKNVGEDVVRIIVKEREKNGAYKCFDDLIYRNIDNKLQKRTVEYLIKGGALDRFGDRNQMLADMDSLYEMYKKEKESVKQGQIDLFGGGGTQAGAEKVHILEPVLVNKFDPVTVHQKLQWEKELLGLYMSSHPLDDLQEFLESKKVVPIAEVLESEPGRKLHIIAGIPTKIRRITTKNDEDMAFMTIEDKSGAVDCVLFPRSYEELKDEIQPNVPLLLAGKLNEKKNEKTGNNEKSFIIDKAKAIDETKFGSNFKGVTLKIRPDHSEDDIKQLREFIRQNNGDTAVRIQVVAEQKLIPINQKILITEESEQFLSRFY